MNIFWKQFDRKTLSGARDTDGDIHPSWPLERYQQQNENVAAWNFEVMPFFDMFRFLRDAKDVRRTVWPLSGGGNRGPPRNFASGKCSFLRCLQRIWTVNINRFMPPIDDSWNAGLIEIQPILAGELASIGDFSSSQIRYEGSYH